MKKKIFPKKKAPDRASDLPVTVGIIEEFREEMRASFRGVDRRFDSVDRRFESVDQRFESVDQRFDSVDRRFDSVENKIESVRSELKADIAEVKSDVESVRADVRNVEAKIEAVKADTSRTKMLIEEQTSRNNIVLDGLTTLFERQERVEGRVDEVERTMALFKKANS